MSYGSNETLSKQRQNRKSMLKRYFWEKLMIFYDLSQKQLIWVSSPIEISFLTPFCNPERYFRFSAQNGTESAIFICTVDGKKNLPKVFCSHFKGFYPIDFIFIEWVGYDKNLFRVPRNFDFKPTNPIFSPKRQMNHFRKWPFLGV